MSTFDSVSENAQKAVQASKDTLARAKEEVGKLKDRDFKADFRKGVSLASGVAGDLKKHDFRAEVRDAFAEAKKDPKSIWKKPDAPRPGKDLAIAGLAVSIVLFLLLLATSSSFLGFLCLVLAVGGLLFSLLGLKTEGRRIAIGGAAVGLLAVVCSFGQMFGGGSSGGGSGKGGKYAIIEANEGEKASSASKVIAMAENAKDMESLNFFGFYTGMSFANAKLLREHYGLTENHLWFYYNKENGEVYQICFAPKAITSIMDVANNFKTIENALQDYLGLDAWNNEKQVIEGEVDSLFQDEGEKFWLGDAADVVRKYKTADGVTVSLNPKQKLWDSGNGVLSFLDSKRSAKAVKFNRMFSNNNKMRQERIALEKKGCKTKMLNLPNGYEHLLKEYGDSWVSVVETTKEESKVIFGNDAVLDNFNALPNEEKGDLTFRLLFPEEADLIPLAILEKLSDALREETRSLGGDPSKSATPEDIRKWFMEGEKILWGFFVAEGPEAAKKHEGRLSQPEVWDVLQKVNEDWEKYNYHFKQERALGKNVVSMSEDEFKRSYLLKKGYLMKEGGNIFKASEEELNKIEEEGKAKAEEQRKAKTQKMTKENNDKVDSAKSVLAEAGIKTKEIELSGGVRMLMTYVNENVSPDSKEKVEWVSTFEVTEAQVWAVLNDAPSSQRGDFPHLFNKNNSVEANNFVKALNSKVAGGWTFSCPTPEYWDFASGGIEVETRYMETHVRLNTLNDRKQGKSLKELKWDYIRMQDSDREEKLNSVGSGEPNYYGLYDMFGNAVELQEPYLSLGNYGPGNVDRRKSGALRLFATFADGK